MTLENDLRRTLARESPAPGFAQRVMQRIGQEGRPPSRISPARRWRSFAAASLTILLLGGGWAAHEIRERRQGREAREQVLLAMRITGEKIRYAREEVHSIGSATDGERKEDQ